MRHVIKLLDDEVCHFGVAAEIIQHIPHQARLVGGAVRDLLARPEKVRPVVDLDFSLIDAGKESLELLATQLKADGVCDIDDSGLAFGHIKCLKDGFEVEFGFPRKEAYSGKDRHPVVVEGTMEDDILRRDFTVNSLFSTFELDGECIVLTTDRDVDMSVLETVKDDPMGVLIEDPIRALRAARFAGYGYKMSDELYRALLDFPKEEFARVSGERIGEELIKVLEKGDLDMLFKVVSKVIPEFDAVNASSDGTIDHIKGVVMAARGHGKSMLLAALLHDICKPAVAAYSEKKGRWTYYRHEFLSLKVAERVLGELRLDKKTSREVCMLIEYHMQFKEILNWTSNRRMEFVLRHGPENVKLMEGFNRFDWAGKPESWRNDMRIQDKEANLRFILDISFYQINESGKKEHRDALEQITQDICSNKEIAPKDRGAKILEKKAEYLASIQSYACQLHPNGYV